MSTVQPPRVCQENTMASMATKKCVIPQTVCPGGCLPGQCLNTQCPHHMFGQVLMGRPELEQEAEFHRQCIEEAKKKQFKEDCIKFLADQRKAVGMVCEDNEMKKCDQGTSKQQKVSEPASNAQIKSKCPKFDTEFLKTADSSKSMRRPARPLCMLDPPPFTPPSDDYAELSRFLRISTMPGYNLNDTISEYRDQHNQAVWNNRREIDPQIYKMKRDWLSKWGESNVIEQRWRKAWVEKFNTDKSG